MSRVPGSTSLFLLPLLVLVACAEQPVEVRPLEGDPLFGSVSGGRPDDGVSLIVMLEPGSGSGEWLPLASVAANTTAYMDGSVQRDFADANRVRATNAGGASAWSNEAQVAVACVTKGNSAHCR